LGSVHRHPHRRTRRQRRGGLRRSRRRSARDRCNRWSGEAKATRRTTWRGAVSGAETTRQVAAAGPAVAIRGEARGRTAVPPAVDTPPKPKALADWLALRYWLRVGPAEAFLLLHVAGSRARSKEAGSARHATKVARPRPRLEGPRFKVQGSRSKAELSR